MRSDFKWLTDKEWEDLVLYAECEGVDVYTYVREAIYR
jgi:hypothetical protein